MIRPMRVEHHDEDTSGVVEVVGLFLLGVPEAMTARDAKRDRTQAGRLERAALDVRTATWLGRRFLHVAVADARRTVRRRRRRFG